MRRNILGLGWIEKEYGTLDEAKRCAEEGNFISKELNIQEGVVESFLLLGDIERDGKRYLKKALGIAQKENIPLYEAIILYMLSRKSGNRKNSTELKHRACDILKKFNIKLWIKKIECEYKKA